MELVGLAAEIATLSTRIEQTLLEISEAEASPPMVKRKPLVCRALSVLAPETTFDNLSRETLRGTLDLLEEDRREMLKLRREVDGLVDRWTIP